MLKQSIGRPIGTPLSDARSQMVVKANELIQKSRFNLTLQQQKVILYLISKISPHDDDFKFYEFSISEFCKVCGIDHESGKNYSNLKSTIKDIADKSMWVKIVGKGETLLRWIEKPYIDENSGTIGIRLDQDMKPYLLQLKESFTKYELVWTLRFKSKYSIRLYELAKSLQFNETWSYERAFEIEELKGLLGAEKYKTFQHFKDRALEPAVKEVSLYSDKTVSYRVVKKGRAITQVILNISSKSSLVSVKLRHDIEKDFGLDQMTLWETLVERGYVRGD